MSFLKRLFGGGKDKSVAVVFSEPEQVRTFCFESGLDLSLEKLYELQDRKDHEREARFLQELFKQIPQCSQDQREHELRDQSCIGRLFEAGVESALDRRRPPAELFAIIKQAKQKSPITAARLEKKSQEVVAKRQMYARLDPLRESLKQVKESKRGKYPKMLREVVAACEGAGAWWEIRKTGIQLSRMQKFEGAWLLFEAALDLAKRTEGNVATVYEAMADLRKKQGRHGEAAALYLRSCLSAHGEPTKRSYDQLRISIKKSGAKADAAALRNQLLSLRRTKQEAELLQLLKEHTG